jgi:hypothetical protein
VYIGNRWRLSMSDIVPRNQVAKHGAKGVGALAGGVGLVVLSAITSIPWIGPVVGGVIALAGFALTGSKSDRTAGVVTAVAGVVTVAASLIPGLRWLIWLPGIGLIGAGVWSLVKFFRGMKSRS